jgi:hypothetical protein
VYVCLTLTNLCSAPPPLVDAIAAIEQRHQNGEEDQMVPELCVMLVVCVRLYTRFGVLYANVYADYAKLTRKMGGKAMTSSNLRPKSFDHGSPTA